MVVVKDKSHTIRSSDGLYSLMQLHGVDDNVSKSKKILSNMSKRMNRNKCIISTIVAVLVLVIMLTLYFKLSK